MTRIIIAGSRKFNNYEKLSSTINKIISTIKDESIEIISGGCTGADALADKYAWENEIRFSVFAADWATYGKAAGPIRNRRMAEYAAQGDHGILVAFPIGESRGTRNMINVAKEYGLEVEVVE